MIKYEIKISYFLLIIGVVNKTAGGLAISFIISQ